MEKEKFSTLIVLVVVGILICASMFSFVSAEKGEGGAAVPVTTIDLTEQGSDYSMKPGRLKFEFDGKLYAIQVRRVKQEYVWFLVMTLDMDNLDDITAYTLDDSFNLSIGETKEIDIDKDDTKDIFIELNDIISTGEYGSIRYADFSIKKINTKKSETILTKKEESIETDDITEENVEVQELVSEPVITLEESVEVQESVSEPVITLNQEPQKQPTFLEKIIDWFKSLFGFG